MIRYPGQTSYYYLPLLETKDGKVYLNTGTTSVVDFETYNGFTPSGDQAIQSGMLSISSTSDPIYQGRLSLTFNGSAFELGYNGSNWSDNKASVVPAEFYLALDYKDAAWSVVNGGVAVSDLFPVTYPAYTPSGGGGPVLPPNAQTGPTYEFAGGSRISLHVVPLVMPEVASISPSSIIANGIQQAVTVTLQRPLNPSQNPNVVFYSSELTVLAGVVANKNSYGSIIGWTFNVIAPSQAFATGYISMSASESLQYLKNDLITTEAVTYMSNVGIGAISIAGSIAATITSIVASAYMTTGWTSITNGIQEYAGNIQVAITASSISNNFLSAKVIAKPNGTTARIDLGTATPNGQPYTGNTTSGGIIYYQDYTLVVNTGTLLNTSQNYDLGAVVTTADLNATTLWSSNLFWNCNPTSQFSAYTFGLVGIGGTTQAPVTITWTSVGGIPATSWVSPSGGTAPTPLALFRTSTNLVFGIKEVWQKEPSSQEPVLRAELRLGAGTLLATATTRNAAGTLVFPSIPSSIIPIGANTLFVRIFSKATGYTWTAPGYLDTPAQPITMALTGSTGSGGGGGGGGGGCFVPETYVMTVDGPKKIKDIKIGDLIMTISEKDYEAGISGIRPFKVSDKLIHSDKPYGTLNINGVLTTSEHLWATIGNTFDRSDAITKVMAIDLADQSVVPVAVIKLEGPVVAEVQNLTVEEAHTFLVAPSMFGPWSLVHNMKSQNLAL